MAECFDLEKQLQALREQKAANEAVQRRLAGELNQAVANQPEPKPIRFRMLSGDKLEINPQRFWNQVERDAMAMDEEAIGQAMRAGFEQQARPIGSKGLHINYAQLPFGEENLGKLLEVLALKRNASEKGVELRRPYTEGVADAQFRVVAMAYGAEPGPLFDAMKRKLAGIDQLPVNAYIVNRVKMDAVRTYADALDEASELMKLGALDDTAKTNLANVAQWAHAFEQFDNQVSRKIAQALRTRQFGDWANENIFMKFDKDVNLLTLDEIKAGSLLAQVEDAIASGDPTKLKRLATAKRLDELAGRSLNEPNFMTQVRVLGTYRKDNFFSGAATWLFRNPTSILVSGAYGLEDIAEGALKYGLKSELGAMGHAFRSVQQGMNTAWLNAWDNFAYGKKTFDVNNYAELSDDILEQTKATVNRDLNDAWELFTTPAYHAKTALIGTSVTFLNLLNLSFRKLLGAGVEQLTGTTAGYTPSFRLLNGGDEVIRKMSFDWKVNHEAWLRASKEAEGVVEQNGRRVDRNWIRQRADQLAEKAVFSGLMTDDELAKLRLRELGATAGDMDNEELRLLMFNNLHGTPNAADELGKLGVERGNQVTFTQKLDDRFTQGVQLMRSNPLAGWVIPVWRVPANGIKWLFGHDMYVQIPKQLYIEAKNAFADGGWARPGDDSFGKFWEGGAVDADLLAKSRASFVSSLALASTTQLLWEAGIFSDGGPTKQEDRDRLGPDFKPYSFSVAFGGAQGLAKLSGASIDLIDLMGLQADLLRARHEGRIDNNSFTTHMEGIVHAYARTVMNKASLTGVTSLLNAVFRAGRGDDVDWATELGKQMNGILPLSGLFTSASRGFNDPNEEVAKRRELTPAEYQALKQDPTWEIVNNIASRIFKDYPILGQLVPPQREDKDWLGDRIERPLGLSVDETIPFMPVIVPNNPLRQWLRQHGLGMKPRPEGTVSEGLPVPTNMTIPQEATYREAMRTIPGTMPAAAVLGAGNATINVGTAVFNVDSYVQGKTLKEALDKLRQDPEYNLELNSPGGPSLVTQPNKPLSIRKDRVNDPRGVYEVFNAIVTYYDKLGVQEMVRQHPEFQEMALGNLRALQGNVRARLEASPLGLGRQ
jgi:hypothetical protein